MIAVLAEGDNSAAGCDPATGVAVYVMRTSVGILPVVNAAPNPHMRYDFNLHPRTVEEYNDCIQRADRLGVSPNKESIEEFYYMYNFFRHVELQHDCRKSLSQRTFVIR